MKTKTFQPRHIFPRISALALALTMALGAVGPAFATAPTNDDFDFAAEIIAPANITMDQTTFVDSTQNVDDPNVCGFGNPGQDTVWYTYIPLTYGEVTVDTFGSDFDTIIAVWTGIRTNLTEVVCNDDTALNLQSQVSFFATPGVAYYIEVVQFISASAAPTKELGPVAEPNVGATDYLTLNLLPTSTYAAPGKYDSKPPNIFSYSAGWALASQAKAYKGSIQKTSTNGAKATVNFYGNQFKLIFTKASAYGNLSIIVDGGAPTTISQKRATAAFQQSWTSPLFVEGYHTVQFARSSAVVNVDAIEVFGTADATPPGSITDLFAVSGVANGMVDLTWTATGDDNNLGIAKYYDLRYSTSPITLANWNTAKQASGEPSPHAPGYLESMTLTGLTPGLIYYFAVRAVDDNYSTVSPTPNMGALSEVLVSAQATFTGTAAVPNIYENTAPAWMYAGTWVTTTNSKASGLNYSVSSVIGNSAIMVFNSTHFTLSYCVGPPFGKLSVYVDDVLYATLNQYNSLTAKCNVKYNSIVFSAGQHSLKLVHVSKKANIDKIEILP